MSKNLKLSAFGERFTRLTGALELMDDLGRAMAGESSELMLGGGNPGKVPAIQARLMERLGSIANDSDEFERMLSNYAHPQGELRFRRSLAGLLSREYGWDLDENNIALTGGSQSAFFMLFNLFGGRASDGNDRQILLPMSPEYVGYTDLGLGGDLFTAQRPVVEEHANGYFKYRLDFDQLNVDTSIGAVCISRPTNPTGNVLTDGEVARLDQLCRQHAVPLIVDAAYGAPFPNIVFVDARPIWNENIIYCMSLSKFGLPAARTGIIVASHAVIEALTRMTAILNLTVGSVGAVMVQPWIESGEILELSSTQIMPFYRDKALRACEWLQRELDGVPFRIHEPEGALFLWLWFPGLPISNTELYERLKRAGVFVLSGQEFFPGLDGDWTHRHECLRLSYAQDDATVRDGVKIIAQEVRKVFDA